MENKNWKLYYEPVAEFIGNLVAMYNRIKDLDMAIEDEDCKCYYQICERVDNLQTLCDNEYETRYENDHYDDLKDAIEATEYPLWKIHDTDYFMDCIKWMQSKFWVSHIARATSGLDDTWLYVFDDTCNTYDNFGYDSVKDIIVDILSNLEFDTKVLFN